MKARMLCALLTFIVSTGALLPPHAAAALITTGALLANPGDASAGFPAQSLRGREHLRARLAALGVNPDLVRARVDALTDEEAIRLAARIDTLPAGGDAVGAVIFVFLVLLVTDVLGYTDVYPFITRTVNGTKHAECPDPGPATTETVRAAAPQK